MTGTMAKRPRLVIDIEDRHRRAFHIWAAAHGLTTPDAFAKFVEDHLQEFLAIADKQLAAEKPSRPPRKP